MSRSCRLLSPAVLPAVLLALPILLAALPLRAGEPVGTKDNLDLPVDARGEIDPDVENPPEIVIFYDQQFETDGMFYVIDRSGTMQDSGELAIAKREMIRNISEFSEHLQFGIVFFDANVTKFPSSGQPAEASQAMKASATSYVQSMPGGGGTCSEQGIIAGLQMANRASCQRKVLVYLGDGGGTCQGANEATYLQRALAAITASNYQRIQINCIGILNPKRICEEFMKQLAAANGGTYTRKQ